MTSQPKVYGIDRPSPSLTSNLETMMRIPTNTSLRRCLWIGGKQSRRIITVSTSAINGISLSIFISVSKILGREALVVLE